MRLIFFILLLSAQNCTTVVKNKQTPLYEMIYHHQLTESINYIQNGADVSGLKNYRFSYQQTALHIATLENNDQALLTYTYFGIPIDAQDINGNTALILAVQKKYLNIAEILLIKGSNPYIKNNQGASALSIASLNNDDELLELLLSYKSGQTAP